MKQKNKKFARSDMQTSQRVESLVTANTNKTLQMFPFQFSLFILSSKIKNSASMATVLTVSLQIDNLQNSLGFQLRIIVSLLTTYKMLLKNTCQKHV